MNPKAIIDKCIRYNEAKKKFDVCRFYEYEVIMDFTYTYTIDFDCICIKKHHDNYYLMFNAFENYLVSTKDHDIMCRFYSVLVNMIVDKELE